MKVFEDQIGETVRLNKLPQRIVSLVPSQTELLFYLGLGDRVVGVTKFCVHPLDELSNVQKIGGTKNFNMQAIDDLSPDLIIGNKEENYQEGIVELKEKHPVWVSDIATLEDAYSMIVKIGELVGAVGEAEKLVVQVKLEIEVLKNTLKGSVLYFIWQKPFMLAAKGTFIHELMVHLGLTNLVADSTRYPELTKEELETLDPDFILLSSEPYPFKQKHINAFETMFPNAKVVLVDGEMFSWYGNRMLYAAEYLRTMLPALISNPS